MSAYATYLITGHTKASGLVSLQIQAVNTPTQEAAEWLLREVYPTAERVEVTRPAARNYKPVRVKPLRATTLTRTPLRRTR